MKSRKVSFFVVMVALAAGGLVTAAFPAGADGAHQLTLTGAGHHVRTGLHGETDVNTCSDAVGAGFAYCHARVRTNAGATPATSSSYNAAQLQAAYNAPSATNGAGRTIAIVDAYDSPTAESDLATYRSQNGLPPCTTANHCFTKLDQNGGSSYPAYNSGWAMEIALDLDMVSAICPNCNIVLVEAMSSSFTNLGTAENRAVTAGANVVSNSWGGDDGNYESLDTTYFNHPGVAITFSSGDSGFGSQYPASSPYVVAVGGTSLHQTGTSGRNATQSAWSGAGSGCSSSPAKPVWQTDGGCANRTISDVSADADPQTGAQVFFDGSWWVVGGTSEAAPIIAGFYGLAGVSTGAAPSLPYAHTNALNDITSGSNGSCNPSYLCHGAVGFDGPTGLGTPNGVVAFGGDGTVMPPPTPDFSLTISPATRTTKHGKRAGFKVVLTRVNGLTDGVTLSITGVPVETVKVPATPTTKTRSKVSVLVSKTATIGSVITAHLVATVPANASHGALSHSIDLVITVK